MSWHQIFFLFALLIGATLPRCNGTMSEKKEETSMTCVHIGWKFNVGPWLLFKG